MKIGIIGKVEDDITLYIHCQNRFNLVLYTELAPLRATGRNWEGHFWKLKFVILLIKVQLIQHNHF